MGKNKFSCYILGEDNLTLQCAEIIIASGHKLLGLMSPEEKIKQWCVTHSIPYIENLKQFEKHCANKPFDFLFSIVNGVILPKNILNLPRIAAINYHNSPLPKYAGLYATTWAILNGEKQHGISWHLMEDKIDAGDILKQPIFAIENTDTALSLNIKCFEQAIFSFQELVNELSAHSVCATNQNLNYRSYYSLQDKPQNLGFITWNRPLEEIDRLCRALTFGNYINQLTVPKIIIKDSFFVVKTYKKLKAKSGNKPGQIVAITQKAIQVATATQDILILELTDLKGRNLSISHLAKRFGLNNQSQLGDVEKEFLLKLANSPANNPRAEKFWINTFLACNEEAASFLPTLQKSSNAKACGHLHQKIIPIPPSLLEKLKKFSNEEHSLHTILLTAALIYLYRLNNYKNFTVGYSYNELHTSIAGLDNYLSNHLPLTTEFESSMRFLEALQYISDKSMLYRKNKTYSQDIFTRYPALKNTFKDFDISIEFIDAKKRISFPNNKKLILFVSEDCDWFTFSHSPHFKTYLKSHAYLKNMSNHFFNMLADIASDPNKIIFELSILSRKEKDNLLIHWNNTSFQYNVNKPLQQYIEEQTLKTPHLVAIIYENNKITYQELNQKANKIAHFLRYQGVKQNDLIGVYLERSLEMVIGIMGVLKAGAAYLPLDPNYPEERVSYMLKDSKTSLIITNKKHLKKIPQEDFKKIEINTVLRLDIPESNPEKINKPHDLAYVIYTSGTTGKPKGVAIPHRAICNHMVWMHNKYDFIGTDIFLQKTPFSFDASVWEFFMPLIIGATLVVASCDAHASPTQLIYLVKRYGITIIQLVPSMLNELLATPGFNTCQTLRHVFCGGEALLSKTILSFFACHFFNAQLHNFYGPTEATIDAIALTCTKEDAKSDFSRIGKPIFNTQIYVLDRKMQLVPIGITGELYISGDGLAHGYLNNPKLTKSRFILNPFSQNKKDKMYKTGDLVKWQMDGNIEYIGRCDNQVKIRGFRIELLEIEAHLEKIPYIEQAIVVPQQNPDSTYTLSAYLVIDNTTSANLEIAAIRFFLKKQLPLYMIPSRFFIVDKLLKTPSGKINRKTLPIPIRQLTSQNNHQKPNTATEKTLHSIWLAVLNLEDVGINDDFFELGGNSLTAMKMLTLIQKQFSLCLSIRKLFMCPTIHALAKEIEKAKIAFVQGAQQSNLAQQSIVPLKTSGFKTPLFLIHPVGGSVFWYKALAQYLDKDTPLYAIQDPGLDNNDFLFSTLEEMATVYLNAIQSIQPSGPYLIGGASFGTTVAVEIAKQFQEKEETVAAIIALDGWAMYPSLQKNETIFKQFMQEQNERVLKKYLDHGIHNANFLLQLQWQREKMLMRYQIPIIQAKFILFKAKTLTDLFQYNTPTNWWENYTRYPIEIYTVPGDHESMFYEPNIKTLARKLNCFISGKNKDYLLTQESPVRPMATEA